MIAQHTTTQKNQTTPTRHIMFREKSLGPKNLTLEGEWISIPGDVFTGVDGYVANGVVYNRHGGIVTLVTKCYGNPLEPTSEDPRGHLGLLKKEHGYFAIEDSGFASWEIGFTGIETELGFRTEQVKVTEYSSSGEVCRYSINQKFEPDPFADEIWILA